MNQSCDPIALKQLLNDSCDIETQNELESHLDHCADCQTRLSKLAADEALWTQAATHLSTIEKMILPEPVSNRLQNSSSFVVAEISDPPVHRSRTPNHFAQNNWTSVLDPPSHPEMLGRIDQFEVESKIGQGGMGVVLKGYDRALNRPVAIKILAPQFAANGTARQRFAREAEAAAAVMHPNVVPIYAVNKSPDRPYIVMQLVSGHSLQSLVQEKGPLNPTDVVRVSMQIAAGLSSAHKLGLIHRDVKPSNMLVERDVSRVMITDFGLARAADDAGMTQTGWLAGTPHYMSPEQAKGEDLDTRNDLFSLGSLMYFIATGREPFRGDSPYSVIQKIVNVAPTNPIEINPAIPPALAEIIEKLLEKDQKNRFQSAAEAFNALEQYLAFLQQPTSRKPPKRLMTSRRKRKRAWNLGALVGTVLLASLLVLGWLNADWFKVTSPDSNGSKPLSASSDEPKPLFRANSPLATEPKVSPARTAIVPMPEPEPGFGFNDDAFVKELEEINQAVNRLERGFLENQSGNRSAWTGQDQLPNQLDRFKTELNSFESNLDSSHFPLPTPNRPAKSPESPKNQSQSQQSTGRQDEN